MSRAFVKEDSSPDNQDELQQVYLRDRIAQLGGGDYERGLAYLESDSQEEGPSPSIAWGLLPPTILRQDRVLRSARRYADQSRELAVLVRLATDYRNTLVGLLTSTEPTTAQTLADGGKAYGAFMQAAQDVRRALRRVRSQKQPA